jgi:uncharacterized membrane protein
MNPIGWVVLFSLVLFVAMLACLEGGFRLGHRDAANAPERAHEGIGVIEAAVFALVGLLLGFSFAGGTSRLDNRRQLIVDEANAIGTAYLRVDLLTASDQPEMRRLFRDYVDARLVVYGNLSDAQATERAVHRVEQIQAEIWSRAIDASRSDQSHDTARLLLPALNQMIDITTARTIAVRTHLPTLILALLSCVALLSGLLAGYAMAKRRQRSWLHMVLYAAVIAMTIYTVLDLDNPRSGFIHLAGAEDALKGLQNSLK